MGYCEGQNLLNYRSPFAYSCGVYGWSCDYYDVNGVLISTGYQPISSKNTLEPNYKLIREFDDKAMGKSKEEREAILLELVELLTK